MRTFNRLLVASLIVSLTAIVVGIDFTLLAQPGEDDGPSRQEMDGARYRLEQFEQRVERANGSPFQLGHTEREALSRIRDLAQRFPDNPQVQELVERARVALLASRGRSFEITPEMIAYREMASRVIQIFNDISEEAWQGVNAALAEDETALTDAFPAPDPMTDGIDEQVGRAVRIDGLDYPERMFTHLGKSYLAVGSGTQGYYFIDLSSRAWLGCYEAVRRYRREVGGEIPRQVTWSVVGTIQEVVMAVPQAGEETVGDAHLGWVVQPRNLYIPGFVMSEYLPDHDLSGQFIGEDRVEEIKGPLYTITSVPENATPQAVTDAWITAIKERNYDLWLSLLDPTRRETPRQISLCNYHWDLHLGRWAETFVHYELVEEPEVVVVRGEELDEDEMFFLTEEERRELLERSEPIERLATLRLRMYDERGNQVETPQNFYLRQYQDGRWWVDGPHLPS